MGSEAQPMSKSTLARVLALVRVRLRGKGQG